MILDEATTAAWNLWFSQGFDALMAVHIESINKVIANIHRELDESATNTDLDESIKDTNTTLDKAIKNLETKIIETRANVTKELHEDLIKALANIPSDIESMRKKMWEDLIFKLGCDMNLMLVDTRSLIRKNIEDEVREVVDKQVRKEVSRYNRYSRKPPKPPRKPQPPNNVTDIGTKQKA